MTSSRVHTWPAALALLLAAASAARAQVTIAGPTTGHNCIPFGCILGAGTRYQQVYSAGAFAGPIDIGAITFFLDTDEGRGNLNTGSISLYLSTTAAAVDRLNASNFDANLGPSTSLFGTYTIGGVAPTLLTFTGVPYLYDPAAGNLLLDLRVNGTLAASTSLSGYLARVNMPGGNYSRATDFGVGSAGYGLDTRFALAATTVPEPSAAALLGAGLLAAAGAGARRRRSAAA